MSSETRVAMPRLRLRLTAAAEARIRSGHPWVFAKSIREQNRDGKSGELAVVYDRQDRFFALGLLIRTRRYACEFCTLANRSKSIAIGGANDYRLR
jgi:23S rRNA G2069 N7-methylase RlmK/C1962 C5-methylase RlmI